MKKLMTLMIGAGLAFGAITMYANAAPQKSTAKKSTATKSTKPAKKSTVKK